MLCSQADISQSLPSLFIADVFASHIADLCIYFLLFVFDAEVHLLFISRNQLINLDYDIKRLKLYRCLLFAVCSAFLLVLQYILAQFLQGCCCLCHIFAIHCSPPWPSLAIARIFCFHLCYLSYKLMLKIENPVREENLHGFPWYFGNQNEEQD